MFTCCVWRVLCCVDAPDKARRLRQRKPLQALAALHESRMEAIRYGNYDNRMVPDWARTWQARHVTVLRTDSRQQQPLAPRPLPG